MALSVGLTTDPLKLICSVVLVIVTFINIFEGTYYLYLQINVVKSVFLLVSGIFAFLGWTNRWYLKLYLVLNVPFVVIIPFIQGFTAFLSYYFWGLVIVQVFMYLNYVYRV